MLTLSTRMTSHTDNVARCLVGELNSADIGPEERLFLQDLLEQIRPRVVDPGVFEGYHERQVELCMPFSRRFGMLHSAYSYDQYGSSVTNAVGDVRSILALTGINWQELAAMNELEVAKLLSVQEVNRLILSLTIIQALVKDHEVKPQPV